MNNGWNALAVGRKGDDSGKKACLEGQKILWEWYKNLSTAACSKDQVEKWCKAIETNGKRQVAAKAAKMVVKMAQKAAKAERKQLYPTQ
jgi:hypothetical protein